VPRTARLVTELVGTFIFLSVIALSGAAGSLAPLAIGAALTAMVYMGGHVSGAHYNPAVSFGIFLRRKMTAVEMIAYWAAHQALAVEILFTTALVLVILNVAFTRALQGNSFYGIAIGFTIAAAIFVGGPISGGAYNPAVGIGATLGSALFAGGGWSDVWLYIVGPFVGAAIGSAIHGLQTGRDQASDP
jgi:aquaporin Z